MTTIGPWPHWSKQPLWLTRVVSLRPASATSFFSRACTPSPSPSRAGHHDPLVQTKTCLRQIGCSFCRRLGCVALGRVTVCSCLPCIVHSRRSYHRQPFAIWGIVVQCSG